MLGVERKWVEMMTAKKSKRVLVCSTKSHELFKESKGWQGAEPPAGGSLVIYPWGEVLHMRNCPKCGSTLSRIIEKGIPEDKWDGEGLSIILKNGRASPFVWWDCSSVLR